MGFTSFLAKLGKALAEGVAIAAGVGPVITPFLGSKAASVEPVIQNDLTSIASVVTMAEALIQQTGSGASKLAAATPLIAQIVMTSELVSGKKIANPSLFSQGCASITSGVADILNSLDGGSVQTSGDPLPPSTDAADAAEVAAAEEQNTKAAASAAPATSSDGSHVVKVPAAE